MADAGLARQALHAFRLGFSHPHTGEQLEFQADLPDDLRLGLKAWGLRYNHREWLTSHAPG
jgi:23S rRNA pseudouridine1911/1915/1917 synthase